MLNIHQLLAMIGEGFGEYSDEICGAVVNIRGKGDKLALWTKHCNDGEATLNIGWDQISETTRILIFLVNNGVPLKLQYYFLRLQVDCKIIINNVCK